jgi:hypothetical protein
MSYVHNVATRPTTDTSNAPAHEHPRGRGFRILSRLAREQQKPAAPQATPEPAGAEVTLEVEAEAPSEVAQEVVAKDVPEADPVEWTAPVLLFDRPQPAPRHRRDVDVEAEDFAVSAVSVARRSS